MILQLSIDNTQSSRMDKTSAANGRSPSKIFIFLATASLFLALILLPLGLTAFTFSSSFPAGMFCTSFMLAASSFYNLTCFILRLFHDEKKFIKRHARKMLSYWVELVQGSEYKNSVYKFKGFLLSLQGTISSTLSCVCFVACLIGAIMDVITAYLLQRTDFNQCAYTSTNATVSCSSPICPTLTLPARTCYCCYLYDSRTEGGCNTPMYLARQTYFSGVDSCSDITNTLRPMLSAMGGINLLAAIISMVYVFQTNPIVYHDEKDSTAVANQQHKRYSNLDRMLICIKMIINRLLCRTTTIEDTTETEIEKATRDNNVNLTNNNC